METVYIYAMENENLRKTCGMKRKVSDKVTDLQSGCPPSKMGRKTVVAAIFNHFKFDSFTLKPRKGTDKDVKALRKSFERYKIVPEVYDNLNLQQIENVIDEISKEDFTNKAALIVCILTHGSVGEVLSSRDKKYNFIETFINPLISNESLIDIPKIFIKSASKGSNIINESPKEQELTEENLETFWFELPLNTIICDSTFEGFVSFQHDSYGTLFIQNFCKILDKHGNSKDIETIMQEVRLTIGKDPILGGNTKNEEVPTTTSTLLKPFVFGDLII